VISKRSYFFICACGCGTKSDPLGRLNYIRLRPNEVWVAQDCVESLKDAATKVRDAYGGTIMQKQDF